ncbi:uncharacterized protein [Mytilus edulis]|uniref:uncharacterized protein n=1 Tax=Mytilus edulis TaxID=6550 RepID=UPI0039F0F381
MVTRLYEELRDFWKNSGNSETMPLRNSCALCPLKIINCNGTGDWSFSDATLEYTTRDGCLLEQWFLSGINWVTAALSHRGKNKMNHVQKKAFDSLLKYVGDIDKHQKCLSILWNRKIKTESEIVGILAHHLFGPLVDGVNIIEGKSRKSFCCKADLKVGNTSFGNKAVWHGNADIVVRHSIVEVNTTEEDTGACGDETYPEEKDLAEGSGELGQMSLNESDLEGHEDECSTSVLGHGWSSIIEVKLQTAPKKKMPSQVLAQTIVNAFCNAKKNNSLSNLFIPSFLVKGSEVSFHMYNCDQDKLLTSEPQMLCREDDVDVYKLNINTILYIWIALHFDIFDSKVEEKLQENFPCSNFKAIVGSKYQIYKEKMTRPLHICDNMTVQSKQFTIDPFLIVPSRFVEEYKELTKDLVAQFESDGD